MARQEELHGRFGRDLAEQRLENAAWESLVGVRNSAPTSASGADRIDNVDGCCSGALLLPGRELGEQSVNEVVRLVVRDVVERENDGDKCAELHAHLLEGNLRRHIAQENGRCA